LQKFEIWDHPTPPFVRPGPTFEFFRILCFYRTFLFSILKTFFHVLKNVFIFYFLNVFKNVFKNVSLKRFSMKKLSICRIRNDSFYNAFLGTSLQEKRGFY